MSQTVIINGIKRKLRNKRQLKEFWKEYGAWA